MGIESLSTLDHVMRQHLNNDVETDVVEMMPAHFDVTTLRNPKLFYGHSVKGTGVGLRIFGSSRTFAPSSIYLPTLVPNLFFFQIDQYNDVGISFPDTQRAHVIGSISICLTLVWFYARFGRAAADWSVDYGGANNPDGLVRQRNKAITALLEADGSPLLATNILRSRSVFGETVSDNEHYVRLGKVFEGLVSNGIVASTFDFASIYRAASPSNHQLN